MTRDRYRVVAVEMAEQHAGETVWRVRVRSPAGSPAELGREPTSLLYVSQPTGRPVPHDVGALVDIDERLLEREG